MGVGEGKLVLVAVAMHGGKATQVGSSEMMSSIQREVSGSRSVESDHLLRDGDGTHTPRDA